MADTEQSQFSLMSLEDELTCSICLSPFDCPVTIPCGHNFCQGCLLSTWTDTYSCPQCRTLFETIPELKKNTVLSSVVQTFNLRSNRNETSLVVEESKAEKDDVVRCDTCMEAEAAQTCLTCMASFCEEHLRPHRENPTFRVHQLIEPIGNLSEHICPDHHKLMEFFCSQHGRPICSLCLQQVHKGCTFISPEEQRSLKELALPNRARKGRPHSRRLQTKTSWIVQEVIRESLLEWMVRDLMTTDGVEGLKTDAMGAVFLLDRTVTAKRVEDCHISSLTCWPTLISVSQETSGRPSWL